MRHLIFCVSAFFVLISGGDDSRANLRANPWLDSELQAGAAATGTAQELPSCCSAESCESTQAARVFTAEGLSTFSNKLFDTADFPARWYCGTWSKDVGWLHIVSDLGIFAAYFTIPGVLLFFMLRKKDLPFPRVIWLFATFILACGFGHLIEAGIFWWPIYRFSGLVKGFTAIISWVTVFMLIRLMPAALRLPSAALLTSKLIKSQERLDIALEAAEVGIWELDLNTGAVSCDARTRAIFDIKTGGNVKDQFFERIHPEDRELVSTAIQDSVEQRKLFSAKFRVVHGDGSVLHVQSQGKLDFGTGDKAVVQGPLTLVGVSFDITAEQARDTALEKMVADRTASLQMVLDSTGEGLLSVDLNGLLLPERSRTVSTWFGLAQAGTTLWDYLAVDEATKAKLAMSIEQLAEDVLPFEVSADQAPKSIVRDGRTYALEYREIREQGKLARLLVLVRDITAELDVQRAEGEVRELHTVVGNLLKDRNGFDQTLDECEALVSEIAQTVDQAIAKRHLHTLKGNCAVVGFQRVADHVHELESALVEEGREPTQAELADLDNCWQSSLQSIRGYLQASRDSQIEISAGEHAELMELIAQRPSYESIEQLVASWKYEPTVAPLSRLAEQSRQVAARLGKDVKIHIEDNRLRVPESRLRRFWSSMVHVVRNAVDHGVESAEARIKSGKRPTAQIQLTTRLVEDDHFEVEIADDGCGIDWEVVRKLAEQRGLPYESHEDLVEALFADGLSTRSTTTDISGRGVGLNAVRSECEKAGGTIYLESQRGTGTRLTFRFPIHELAAA